MADDAMRPALRCDRRCDRGCDAAGDATGAERRGGCAGAGCRAAGLLPGLPLLREARQRLRAVAPPRDTVAPRPPAVGVNGPAQPEDRVALAVLVGDDAGAVAARLARRRPGWRELTRCSDQSTLNSPNQSSK